MSLVEKYKSLSKQIIDNNKNNLIEISRYIHSNPEYNFEEYKACEKLTEYLKENGFSIEKNVANLPTAFKATYAGKKDGCNVGICGEYDAFPGLGHGCGHNLMASMAVGAGISLKEVVDEVGGTITILGTPAEELGGGKVIMLENGAFKGLDAALILHPANETVIKDVSVSKTDIEVHFYNDDNNGNKPNNLKQNMELIENIIKISDKIGENRVTITKSRTDCMNNENLVGLVIKGVESIENNHYSTRFRVRAFDKKFKDEIFDDFIELCESIAKLTNTRFEYHYSYPNYEDIRNNATIEALLENNFKDLGEDVKPREALTSIGCTDMGNVTHEIPALQSYIKVCEGLRVHTTEFMDACGDERGDRAVIVGAKAMAMTAVDLLCNQNNMKKAKEDFESMKIKHT